MCLCSVFQSGQFNGALMIRQDLLYVSGSASRPSYADRYRNVALNGVSAPYVAYRCTPGQEVQSIGRERGVKVSWLLTIPAITTVAWG